jgi:hypothetical protein
VVAGLVAGAVAPGLPGLGGPALYQAAAYQARPAGLDAVLAREARRRVPVGLKILLNAAEPVPFLAAYELKTAAQEKQFLPLSVVEGELRKDRERVRVAIPWVAEVMAKVRARLEQDRSNPKGMPIALAEVQAEYPGLEVYHTPGFRNQFDVARDPALKGFVDSFERYRTDINMIEGRSGTERMLKEGDFYRLFFTPEPFSVGNTTAYDPRIWPPVVTPQRKRLGAELDPRQSAEAEAETPKTLSMWEGSEKPILFWKSDFKAARMPKDLAEVRPEVTQAFKMLRARDEVALPEAQKVAGELRKTQVIRGDFLPVMEQQARRLGTEVIMLHKVTPMVEAQRPDKGTFEWQPYQVPKDLIPYPAENTSKDLLALSNLSAPLRLPEELQVGNKKEVNAVAKRLNEVNKELFDKTLVNQPEEPGKARTPQVQILTNRPHTVFYVAAVVRQYPPDRDEFVRAWFEAALARRGDTLIDQTQEQSGRAFENRFVRQLRQQAGLEPDLGNITAEQRKDFDSSEAS